MILFCFPLDVPLHFKVKMKTIHLVLGFQLLQRFAESILRVTGSGKDKEKRAFQQLEWFGPKKKTRGKDAEYHEMCYFVIHCTQWLSYIWSGC